MTEAYRALTPLFGNGAGAHGIGKISGVLTKIGKIDIVLMYDVSISRLIPIIKLSYCTMRKGKERSKCCYILLFCDEIKMENKKQKIFFFFFVKLGIFFWNWEKDILFGIGNGAEFRPQNRVIESPGIYKGLSNLKWTLGPFNNMSSHKCKH